MGVKIMKDERKQFIKGDATLKAGFNKGHIPWNKGVSSSGFGLYPENRYSGAIWNKGKHWSENWKLEQSRKRLGKTSNTGRTHFKMGQMSGSNNPRWKGGITSQNNLIKNSREYKQWRTAVFKRDGWTCVMCGYRSKKRKDIQADHIKPFSIFPEFRFDIDNGRTLCLECHINTESYANNYMKREDFIYGLDKEEILVISVKEGGIL